MVTSRGWDAAASIRSHTLHLVRKAVISDQRAHLITAREYAIDRDLTTHYTFPGATSDSGPGIPCLELIFQACGALK